MLQVSGLPGSRPVDNLIRLCEITNHQIALWNLDIGIYLVVLVLLGFGIYAINTSALNILTLYNSEYTQIGIDEKLQDDHR